MDGSYGALSNLLSLGVLPQLQVSLTWPSTKENRKIVIRTKACEHTFLVRRII